MSRFRLPARVAPSPAAEEPGLQNSAARLRSSREVQSRILAERRAPEQGGNVEGVKAQLPDMTTEHLADPEFAGKREGESRSAADPHFAARRSYHYACEAPEREAGCPLSAAAGNREAA